jgi:hypothetical protein
MRSCCVALRPNHQPARQRGIAVVARFGDASLTDREAKPRAAANEVGIDCPASDEGCCICVIHVLLPTI